jgi:hypothetical protein
VTAAGKARLSRGRLSELDTDDLPAADARAEALRAIIQVPGDVVDAVQEVFAGTPLALDQERVQAVLNARAEVGEQWSRAKKSFLLIGRALNRLDAVLTTREERRALKAGFERLFPMSEPIAAQFRRVAEAVDSGRIPEALCPGSYSAAYQLALLSPRELEAARERGLVAPETQRRTLIVFRRELLASGSTAAPPTVDPASIAAELRRIEIRLSRIETEADALRTRRAELLELTRSD